MSILAPPVQASEPDLSDSSDLARGAPTRLVISAIRLDAEIVPVRWKQVVAGGKIYRQWEVSDDFVGWHYLSARLNEVGNMVFSGHSNIHAQVFRDLSNVEIGDEITVFSSERTYLYVITDKFLVQERGVSIARRLENGQWIAPTQDKRLTLITCAESEATHRLIVVARPAVRFVLTCEFCPFAFEPVEQLIPVLNSPSDLVTYPHFFPKINSRIAMKNG
jgi:LPXTG-site transpeptidase (sortase) family protein